MVSQKKKKMSDFKEISLGTFKECKDRLAIDEFIFTDDMNAYASMSALDVGQRKIDCHMMCKGKYTIPELLQGGYYLPDEKITIQEIQKICAYFLDCLVARLDGNTPYQTTLLSVYIHKGCEIKNPFLKEIILSFTAIANEIEIIGNKIAPNTLAFWARIDNFTELVHDYDIKATREALEKYKNDETKDIIIFCQFLLDFAEYLNKFPTNQSLQVPAIPENLFEESENIGFCENLHLRNLSTRAPPTKLQIKDHKTSIELFHKCFDTLKNITSLPKPETILEAIKQGSEWSLYNQDAMMFPRLLRIGMALGFEHNTPQYYGEAINDLIKRELQQFHTAENVFSHADFPTIAHNVHVFLIHITRSLYLPRSYLCSAFSKSILGLWGKIQALNINVEMTAAHPRPKTNTQGNQTLLRSTISIWGQFIGSQIAIEYMRHYFGAEVLINNDMPYVALVLQSAYDTIVDAYQKKRTVNAIYAVYQHRKGSKRSPPPMSSDDIDKRKEKEYPEELTAKAMSELWGAVFYGLRHCLMTKALKPKESMFFDQFHLYQSRMNEIMKLREIKMLPLQQYQFLFTNQNANTLKEMQDKFNAARSFIKKAMDNDTNNSKADPNYKINPINKAMAMASITSPTTIAKRKTEDIKFTFDLETMLPSFTLVTQ